MSDGGKAREARARTQHVEPAGKAGRRGAWCRVKPHMSAARDNGRRINIDAQEGRRIAHRVTRHLLPRGAEGVGEANDVTTWGEGLRKPLPLRTRVRERLCPGEARLREHPRATGRDVELRSVNHE